MTGSAPLWLTLLAPVATLLGGSGVLVFLFGIPHRRAEGEREDRKLAIEQQEADDGHTDVLIRVNRNQAQQINELVAQHEEGKADREDLRRMADKLMVTVSTQRTDIARLVDADLHHQADLKRLEQDCLAQMQGLRAELREDQRRGFLTILQAVQDVLASLSPPEVAA